MYNEEIKKKFLESVEESYAVRGTFNFTEPYEQEYGVDLCNFTTKQILDMYKMTHKASYLSLMNINTFCRKYVQWALKHGLVTDSQNHFLEVDTNMIMTCIDIKGRNQSIISREELLRIIAYLQNPIDKYIFLAMFEGFHGDQYSEITFLKIDDINENKKTAKLCTGRTIPVSDHLIVAAKETYEMKEYNQYVVKMDSGGKAIAKRDVVGEAGEIWKYIIRKDNNLNVHGRYIQLNRTFNKCAKYLEDTYSIPASYLTGKSIQISGLIHDINIAAKEEGVSGYEFIMMRNNEKYQELCVRHDLKSLVVQKPRLTVAYKEFLQ